MVDFSNPDWSYILGVIHGDGSIGPRSLSVAVGYKDQTYARYLVRLFRSLGYTPKVYRCHSCLRVDVHSLKLTDSFRPYKQKGIWSWPATVSREDYIAGVFDTDGWVATLPAKRIGIILKRSGNLNRLSRYLRHCGVGSFPVRDTKSAYRGDVYLTEALTICRMADIVKFSSAVNLRHYRKKRLLELLGRRIQKIHAFVPLSERIAIWCKEPRTWKEIAKQFRLTEMRARSFLSGLRSKGRLTAIHPPVPLTQYIVK